MKHTHEPSRELGVLRTAESPRILKQTTRPLLIKTNRTRPPMSRILTQWRKALPQWPNNDAQPPPKTRSGTVPPRAAVYILDRDIRAMSLEECTADLVCCVISRDEEEIVIVSAYCDRLRFFFFVHPFFVEVGVDSLPFLFLREFVSGSA